MCVSLYVYVYVKSKSGEREGGKDLKYCICMNKKEISWRKLIEFQLLFLDGTITVFEFVYVCIP